MLKVIEFAFTCYPVTDMARARAFYEGVLGLKPTMVHEMPDGTRVGRNTRSAPARFAIGQCADGWKPQPERRAASPSRWKTSTPPSPTLQDAGRAVQHGAVSRRPSATWPSSSIPTATPSASTNATPLIHHRFASTLSMAILVTPDTRILVQGITGDFGARHAQLSLDYGTQARRRRHARQRRADLRARQPSRADLRHRRGSRARDRRHRQRDLRPAAVRRRCHPRVRRRRTRPRRRHHRRHSGQRHGESESRHARHARRGSSARTAPASSRPAPARIRTAAAASASRPATFTRRATSASSPAAAR